MPVCVIACLCDCLPLWLPLCVLWLWLWLCGCVAVWLWLCGCGCVAVAVWLCGCGCVLCHSQIPCGDFLFAILHLHRACAHACRAGSAGHRSVVPGAQPCVRGVRASVVCHACPCWRSVLPSPLAWLTLRCTSATACSWWAMLLHASSRSATAYALVES